ncbi:cyclic nucleotide-binding domain-containing protein [Jatrophihabitans sp.]|uniref:cyclic nucleotide-binding domain-containing protein n=1 Tax=Jatrophihabitans sp. TaxID=1932789 RepID=UPI0030C710C7
MNREKRELAEELAKLPSLGSVASADLEALAEAGDVVNLPDSWAFVHEGTPADAAYVLLSGEANVIMGRTIVASLAAGAIIGEMAYLDGGQRHATVSTHGRVRAMRINYDKLTPLLAKRPALRDVLRAVDREHRTED